MAAVLDIQTVLRAPKNIERVVKQVQSEFNRAGIKFNPDPRILKDVQRFASTISSIKLSKTLQSDFNKSIRAMVELNREQERARTLAQELGQQTAITAKRFSVYLIASRTLSGLGSTIRTATNDAIKFDRELLKVRQTLTKLGSDVNQLSGSQFGALESTINRTATSFGVAGDELVRASQFFAQAGRNIGEIQTLVGALGRASLTPTFSNVEKSAENLEALLTQFNLRADQGAAVLDKLNNVAKNFNVQVSELFTGIEKSGAAFAASGGAFDRAVGDPRNLRNLEEFVALYTSVISTSRESADVIGTAFKTIIPRLQRTKTRDFLKDQLQIDTVDAQGNFRGVLTIVQDINRALESGGTSTQNTRFAQLVEVLGGQRQYSRIIPLLTQVAKAQDALNAAQSASGSVAQDVELAQENLAVQIQQLREEFALLIRDLTKTGTFQAFAKTLLELARSAITLTAAIEPLIPLLTTLATIRIGSGLFAFGRGFNQKFGQNRNAISIPGLNRGGFAGGGSIRSVMLTPGEGILTPAQVKQYPGGSTGLERLNRFGSGSAPAAMSIVPGTGNTDTVPANLPEGSFVIRKQVTQQLLRKRLGQGFNAGGSVGRQGFEGGGKIDLLMGTLLNTIFNRFSKEVKTARLGVFDRRKFTDPQSGSNALSDVLRATRRNNIERFDAPYLGAAVNNATTARNLAQYNFNRSRSSRAPEPQVGPPSNFSFKGNLAGIALAGGAIALSSQKEPSIIGSGLLGAVTGGSIGSQGGPYGAAIGAIAGALIGLKEAADSLEKKKSLERIADQLGQLGDVTDLKGLIRQYKLAGGPVSTVANNLKTPGFNSGAFSGAFNSRQTLFANPIGAVFALKGLAETSRLGRNVSGGSFSDSLFQEAVDNAFSNIKTKEDAALAERQSLLAAPFAQAQGNISTDLRNTFKEIAGISGSVSEERAAAEARKIAQSSPELARLFGQFAPNAAITDKPEKQIENGIRLITNLGRELAPAVNETNKLNQELAQFAIISRSLISDIDGLNVATEGISVGIEAFSKRVSRTLLRGAGSSLIGDLGLQNRFQNFSRLSSQDLQFQGGDNNLFDRVRNSAVAGERLRRSLPSILGGVDQSFGREAADVLTEAIANSDALKGAPQVIIDALEKNIATQGEFSLVDVLGDPDKFLSSLDSEFRGAQDAIRSFYDVVNAQTQSIAAAIDQRVEFEQENNRKLGSILETASTLRDFQIGARGGNPLEGRNALQELSNEFNTARLGRISVGGAAPNVSAIFNRNQELEQRRNQLLTQFQSLTSKGGDTTRIGDELQKNGSELARNRAAMGILTNATSKLSVVNAQLAEIQQRREASRSLLTDLFDPEARRQLAVNNAATSAILGGNINQLSDKTIRDALQFVFSDAAKLQLEKTGGLERLGFGSIEGLRAEIAAIASQNLEGRGLLGRATDIQSLLNLAGTKQGLGLDEGTLKAQGEAIAKLQTDVLQAQFALGNAALREVGDQIRQQQQAFSLQLQEVFRSDDAASMRDAFNRLSDTLANGSRVDLRITEAEINVNIANAEGIAKALGRDLDGPLRRMIKQSIQEFFN